MARGGAHAYIHASLETLGFDVVGAPPTNGHLDQDEALALDALDRNLGKHGRLNRVRDSIGYGIGILENLLVRDAEDLARLVVNAEDQGAAASIGEGNDGLYVALRAGGALDLVLGGLRLSSEKLFYVRAHYSASPSRKSVEPQR